MTSGRRYEIEEDEGLRYHLQTRRTRPSGLLDLLGSLVMTGGLIAALYFASKPDSLSNGIPAWPYALMALGFILFTAHRASR